MNKETVVIADVLPIQKHYWLLHDGNKYAKHGPKELNGLLVFCYQERAEQFCLTVGKALPKFQPVKVSAETFLAEAKRVGAFCMAEGLLLKVFSFRDKKGQCLSKQVVAVADRGWVPKSTQTSEPSSLTGLSWKGMDGRGHALPGTFSATPHGAAASVCPGMRDAPGATSPWTANGVKRAFRCRVKSFAHPDSGGDSEEFKRLYQALQDNRSSQRTAASSQRRPVPALGSVRVSWLPPVKAWRYCMNVKNNWPLSCSRLVLGAFQSFF